MSAELQQLLGQGLISAGQYEILQNAKNQAGQVPQQVMQGVQDISGMARPYTEFRPFTVTTPSGATTTLGSEGMTMGLGQQQQQTVDNLQRQALAQSGMIGQVTPEQLMSQMQALRAPEQERAQLGLENRLAAQGRLGVQTAAYGGTPEQLAMQKAMQEQQSADALASIQGARNLQTQDINNLTGMMNASYMPQNQALAALTPAIQSQQIGAGLNQTQANLIGQLGQQYLGETGKAGQLQGQLSMEQSNALLQNLLGNTMGTQDNPSSLLGSVYNYLTGGNGGDNSISMEDFINSFMTSGGGSGSTVPYTTDTFVGNLGAYDPESELLGLGGGGVNLPATTVGGGGI